jgi:Cys-rich protein (TIGR01571 family)
MASYYNNQPAYGTNQPAYVTNQPTMGNPLHQFNGVWQVGFCDCCDNLKQCCYAYWCWPCFLCSLAGKIDESCLSCCCLPGSLMMYRMKVRTAFRIQGDSCWDCLAVQCCPCCAGLQMRNEITRRGFA